MEQYATRYFAVGDPVTGTSTTTANAGNYFIDDNSYTGYCPPYYVYPYYTFPTENKKERAYEILKVLVKEEMIKEPKSFKKFCDLIDKIAKAI